MSSFQALSITRCGGLLAVLVFATSPVLAADYVAEIGVDQFFEYDDNIDFGPRVETESGVYTLAPRVGLDGRGERWVLSADLSTPFQRFSEGRLDSDNQDLSLSGDRALLRGSMGFDAGILRNSTHTIDEAGTVERFSERRVLDSFTGYWRRTIGERHGITLTGSGQKVLNDANLRCSDDYVCRGSARLNDYEYTAIQFDWTRALSDRAATQLSVFTTRFDGGQPPNDSFEGRSFVNGDPIPPLSVPNSRSDTVAIQGGLTRVFNERLHGQFMIGWRSVDSRTPFWDPNCLIIFNTCFIPLGDPFLDETKATSTGQLAYAGMDYKGERLELNVSLSRSLSPSGLGLLLETDELATELSIRLRERLQLRLTATALDTSGSTTILIAPPIVFVQEFHRKYYRLRPRLRWTFAQRWSLEGGFELRDQDLRNLGATASTSASSNSVFMTLGYSTERFPVFR